MSASSPQEDPTRTRFAPSPTGDLHVGGAWTALAAWALARARAGVTILRVEDIDTPRVVPGSAARILEDLAWLGLDWDEADGTPSPGPYAPYTQSARLASYEAALLTLEAAGLTYPCDCSRAEIARAASAPHAGEELVYPGTCREAPKDRVMKRPPAIRLRVPEGAVVTFEDAVVGPVTQDVAREVGDFVLRRGDGVFAYQLVCALDDATMRVTDVVRADDLLMSTPRQILLIRLLGLTPWTPRYAHVPLVVADDGERLAKRTRSVTLRELAAQGVTPESVVGTLAAGLGLVEGPPRPLAPREVARTLRPARDWRREPFRFGGALG